jgi:hypothetical protein
MNYRRKNKMLAAALILTMAVSGCSFSGQESGGGSSETEESKEEQGTQSTAENADVSVSSSDTEEMFSDRDKEVGYEESTVIHISLKNSQSECDSSKVEIAENMITIKDEGTYLLSGSLSNGQIVVDAEKTDKLHLIFNNVDINCDTSAAFYVKQADKVFLTLESGSENTLSNKEDFVAIDDNNIDAVIFSKDDLTLNGSGKLTIQADYGHGIVSKDDLVFTGGTYEITSQGHAISGKQSVRIASGDFHLKAQKDGIHSKDSDDEELGFVYIAGGDIEIEESAEGIEGTKVEIAGGTINLTASDDGINAAAASSGTYGGRGGNPMAADENCSISISGGTLYVNAAGDGIDSNGNLYISGGEIYVSGATNGGNGALDYNGEAQITGGIVIAAGVTGMEQNFGTSSTQCSMLVSSTQRQTKAITLKDASGKELASYTPPKEYNSVVISTPEIIQGETYEAVLGEETISVEMTDLIYGSSASSTNMRGGGGGHGGDHSFQNNNGAGEHDGTHDKIHHEQGTSSQNSVTGA